MIRDSRWRLRPREQRRFRLKVPMRRQKVFAVLPTMLTLGNAACGFGSITFAAKVGPEDMGGGHLFVAAMLIFVAMIFDMLDGTVARWTKAASEFGAQLDSLCDAISFGVAPAFLMLRFCQETPSRWLWVIALLYALCAVLRLARFNVETDEDDAHDSFSGLPSPAAAGMVASLPLTARGISNWAHADYGEMVVNATQVILPFITLAVAVLMVSRIRYPHLFNQWFRGRRSRRHVLLLVFALAAAFLIRELALPLLFGYFAASGPVRALWKRRHKPAPTPATTEVPPPPANVPP